MIILPAPTTTIEPPVTAALAVSMESLHTSSDVLSFLDKVTAVLVAKADTDILRVPNK